MGARRWSAWVWIALTLGGCAASGGTPGDQPDEIEFFDESDAADLGTADLGTSAAPLRIRGLLRPGDRVDAAYDTDAYAGWEIAATAGQRLVLDAVPSDATDTILYLYGPKAGSWSLSRSIATNDDHNGARASHLDFTVATAGSYLVVVRESRRRAGRFALTLAGDAPVEPAVTRACTAATTTGAALPLELDARYTGCQHVSIDTFNNTAQWFLLDNAVAGSRFRFRARGNADPYVSLSPATATGENAGRTIWPRQQSDGSWLSAPLPVGRYLVLNRIIDPGASIDPVCGERAAAGCVYDFSVTRQSVSTALLTSIDFLDAPRGPAGGDPWRIDFARTDRTPRTLRMRLTLSAPASEALTVAIGKGFGDAVIIPASVSVPAGAASAEFTVSVPAGNGTNHVHAELDYIEVRAGTLRTTQPSIDPPPPPPPQTIPVEETFAATGLPIAIPDGAGTGVTNSVTVAEDIRITGLRVRADVTHPTRGQLRVQIERNGLPFAVHQLAGGTADDLHLDVPVSFWNGGSARGTWTLRVVDATRGDVGRLDAWSLVVTGTVTR